MAINTVEEAQYELHTAVREIMEDMGEDTPDEGSAALDMFHSLSWDWPADVAAEVSRREFGYVSHAGHVTLDAPDPWL